MKTKTLISAGILATTVLSGGAYARGISVNEWDTGSALQSPDTFVSVDPSELTALSLTGITSLSFSPGLLPTTTSYYIGTLDAFPGNLEYAWGGQAESGDSSTAPDAFEQVSISSSSAGLFSVAFGYDNSAGNCGPTTVCGLDSYGVGETASLIVGTAAGTTTYTVKNPYKLSDDAGLLSFNKDGSLQSASGVGWTIMPSSPSTAAPEIDPASAASALTLLAGFLAVVFGKVPRTLMEPKRS
jgi:hypothetical protein